jgi:glutamyl-tRNA synthetase
MSKQVRVRFAPSPTGPLHIGGVRCPIQLFVCQENNGVFFYESKILNRFVPGAEAYIMEALEWLGISPDETIGKMKNLVLTVKAKENLYIENTLIN